MPAAKKDKKAKSVKSAKPKVFDEVRGVVKRAKPFHIVKGKNYLYFCVQPTQEGIVFQQVLKKKLLSIAAVYNYKDSIIGYLVEFPTKKPYLDISKGAEGAGICFTTKMEHTKPKLVFADQKLRVVSFENNDFYVSVKWKSNQAVDE